MATLTHLPSTSSSSSIEPRIKMLRFGDGYIQRAGDGINLFPEKWDLNFTTRTNDEADAIEATLRSAAGGTLLWTPTGTVTERKFICLSWRRVRVDYNVNTVTCQLEEVFE
jgi:phage-related protein